MVLVVLFSPPETDRSVGEEGRRVVEGVEEMGTEVPRYGGRPIGTVGGEMALKILPGPSGGGEGVVAL